MAGYGPIPLHFAVAVGWEAHLTCFWGECPAEQDGLHEHISRVRLKGGDGPRPDDALEGVLESDAPLDPCERCGTPWDGSEGSRSGGSHTIYDTPSGRLEPGCLFWADCHTFSCPMFGPPRGPWGGFCDGRHLHAVLPDGHYWDVDSRASNCTRPTEPHRCWVRRHDPETETAILTIDKDGDTCSAGAGSIDDGTYHGFLQNGAFTAG